MGRDRGGIQSGTQTKETMKNIEAKLEYQKETGLGLETINQTLMYTKIGSELQDYINWLEEKLCNVLSQQSHTS